MVRWCWVSFQCRGILLIWSRVGKGPTALAIGAGGGCSVIFSLVYHFSFLSPSLWETARYKLKYCLKGPLSPKQQTTNIEQRLILNLPERSALIIDNAPYHNVQADKRPTQSSRKADI